MLITTATHSRGLVGQDPRQDRPCPGRLLLRDQAPLDTGGYNGQSHAGEAGKNLRIPTVRQEIFDAPLRAFAAKDRFLLPVRPLRAAFETIRRCRSRHPAPDSRGRYVKHLK